MGRNEPLSNFPQITTNSVQEAESRLSRTLTDLQIIRVDDRHGFHLRMNSINFGRTSLVFNRYGADTTIKSNQTDDSILFVLGGAVSSVFHLDNSAVLVSPHKAAIVRPAQQVKVERSKNSEILTLRTSVSKLINHLEELTGSHHRGRIVFDRYVETTDGPGAMLKRMTNYLVYELENNELVAKNPGLQKSIDDMLLSAFLSLPNNKRNRLFEDRRHQVAPGLVRRAEEYMRANLKESVTITDLLRISDCSRSVLFSAFRNARGYTPMEFLIERRLEKARHLLLEPPPEASVSSIAMESGLHNLGRFSQVYKRRFGESPSVTIRKRS
jgi:AraC-like DNA-binding protein